MGKQKKNNFFDFFQNFDIYGIKFLLRYKNDTTFSTPLSLLLSIISIIFIIVFAIYYFLLIFNKKSFSIITTYLHEPKAINFSNVPIMFTIRKKSNYLDLDNSLFEFSADIVDHKINKSDNNFSTIRTVKNLEIENCEEYYSNFKEKNILNLLEKIKIKKYQCLKSGQNITFHGRYGDSMNGFSILQININKCNSSKYNNCKSDEEIYSSFNKTFFSIIYLSYSINHYKYEKPYDLILREESYTIVPKIIKQSIYRFNPAIYSTYDGLFFNSKREIKFMEFESFSNDFIIHEEEEYHNNLSIFHLIFNSVDYTKKYERNYMKFQDAFSLIGGWFDFLFIICKLINSYLSQKSLIMDLTNKLISQSCNNYCENYLNKKMNFRKSTFQLNHNDLKSSSYFNLNSPNTNFRKSLTLIKKNHSKSILHNSKVSTSVDFGNPLLIKLLEEYRKEGINSKQIYKISYFDYLFPYKCLKRICKYSLLLLFSEVINGYLSLEKILPMTESFTKMYFLKGNDDVIEKLKKNLFNFNDDY